MRIAIVTAHYPPNFVSGGTLVPQRIADGFAARGHQVNVFAGSINDGQADMAVRTERTYSGVDVQWVTITGMLAWDDATNFANDEVSAEFSRWLGRTRPDVVHFHNMQGFGGSLVSTAAASGAAVAVTTHDMWWWCARQFLVDKELRPCSTVVDCGVCPCERDNAWLVNRNRRLAAHLRNADLVLAPSSAMIDLLSANGVDPQRLALDENPSPDSVRHSVTRIPGDGSVRFVFAGGKHPVKGAAVAVDAARTLADLTGWSLDLYGAEEANLPEGVQSLSSYDSDDVANVLAGYDVLVMASVMLESYSLLTREALAAGCAVITGDNPGPIEVVKDGVNGLVVARGDAEAFGEAMRRLITEDGLLARLQPEPGTLPLRRLEDQLDGLEEHYNRLIGLDSPLVTVPATDLAPVDLPTESPTETRVVAPAVAPAGEPAGATQGRTRTLPPVLAHDRELPPIRNVLIASGITGAPLRYRGYLPQEALQTVGVLAAVHMYRDVQVPRKARTADAVVLYRVPATEQILDLVDMIRSRPDPVPVLFDIDDLVFDPGLRSELDPILTKVPGLDLHLYWQGIRRYRTTLESADAYIGSTDMLCDRVTGLTGIPAHRWANGVGREIARVSDFELYRPRKPGPVRIGYLSGTNTHNEDWAYVEPAIADLLDARPEVELWIGGLLDYSRTLNRFADRIRRLPLKPWTELPSVLRDLDVNLAPLEPGKIFNESKSAIKWLEAALTRTPTVASPSQPFREAIDDGRTGVLADSPEEWTAKLIELVDDARLRHRIGHAAREQVLLALSPAQQGYRYLEILHRARAAVAKHGHRPLFTDWDPEVLSEPYILQAPDHYGPASGLIVAPGTNRTSSGALESRSLRRVAADYRINAISHLRTEGPARSAAKAASVVGRLPKRVLARLH